MTLSASQFGALFGFSVKSKKASAGVKQSKKRKVDGKERVIYKGKRGGLYYMKKSKSGTSKVYLTKKTVKKTAKKTVKKKKKGRVSFGLGYNLGTPSPLMGPVEPGISGISGHPAMGYGTGAGF